MVKTFLKMSVFKLFLYSQLLFIFCKTCTTFNPIVVPKVVANLNVPISDFLNATIEYEFQYIVEQEYENFVIETSVESSVTEEFPIIFEVRQQGYPNTAWQLPDKNITTANKTICINEHRPDYILLSNSTGYGNRTDKNVTGNIVTVTVSTLSPTSVNFYLLVRNVCQILPTRHTSPKRVKITETSSQLMHYHFPREEDSNSSAVVVHLNSSDSNCLIVSVQQPKCPFLGDADNIRYEGHYFTMTTNGSITIQRKEYPDGFFLVLVLLSTDEVCLGRNYKPEAAQCRTTVVDVIVKESISNLNFYLSLVWPLIVFGFQIAVTFLLSYLITRPKRQQSATQETNNVLESGTSPSDSNIVAEDERERLFSPTASHTLKLSDVLNSSYKKIEKRTNLFIYVVLIAALFYLLPAGQLVFMYLSTSNTTGNVDICYYNFECAHPWGPFKDFNHVFSNFAYLAMGITSYVFLSQLFKFIHHSNRKPGFGIPPHPGISYALAAALFIEGILSGIYHVCPCQANFQHDTCFMYVAVILSTLKLYQARHPDKNVGAIKAMLLIAALMVLQFFGEQFENWYYWSVFHVVYFFATLFLAWQMYNNDFRQKSVFYLCLCGILMNLSLMLGFTIKFVLRSTVFNFGSYILYILLANAALYFAYYLAMKKLHGETLHYYMWIFIGFVGILWAAGVWNFMDQKSSWEEPPALRRKYNEHCLFYDSHDLWHMLSAMALCATLVLLETIDLNLLNTSHADIAVF